MNDNRKSLIAPKKPGQHSIVILVIFAAGHMYVRSVTREIQWLRWNHVSYCDQSLSMEVAYAPKGYWGSDSLRSHEYVLKLDLKML